MFCQNSQLTNMHEVSTMTQVRMSNVSDLVASEGKYHLKCWVYFHRRMNKVDKTILKAKQKIPAWRKYVQMY